MFESKKRFCLLLSKGFHITCLLSVFLFASFYFAASVSAGAVQYIYDPVGRLLATVSETGEVTIYNYDSVGNLLYITKETFSPSPPVLLGINPDVLFIGSTTSVSITGQNLLTTKKIETDNPFVSIEISEVTDVRLSADITVSSQALPGPVNLTVTTEYGSATIQAELTSSSLSFGPTLIALAPGSSGTISASIYPPLNKNINIQIKSSDPAVATAPQSVMIPSGGTAAFTVAAATEGIAYISSGSAKTTVYVTSAQLPINEQIISNTVVSVYIDTASSGTTKSSLPVSAYIDVSDGNTTKSTLPISVYVDTPQGNTTKATLPVSVYVDAAQGSASMQSNPASVYMDAPDAASISVAAPVSVKILP